MPLDETDTEKPGSENLGETCSTTLDDMSDYSAQLVCATFFKVPTFRNLSLKKHLSPAAKALSIKHRGNGKYELAKKIAFEVVKREMVSVNEGSNYRCLSRHEIVIQKDLELSNETDDVKSSDISSSGSSSTKSVDETDFSSNSSDPGSDSQS